MPKHPLLGLDRRALWLLLPLASVHTACGPDAPASTAPQRDSQPSSSDDDVADDDDGAGQDDEDAEPTDPRETARLDAALAKPSKSDAGPRAAQLDAGSDAGSPSKLGDAATTQLTSDASSTLAIDASKPPREDQDGAVSAADAHAPVASQARTFKVDSKDEWTDSGFQVEAGRCYEISTKIDDRWLDLDVPADLTGWIDKDDVRLILFEPLRRVAQDDIGFYQFATCVNKKLNECFPVNTSSTVCPKSAGELFFFVNDVSGFESNNVGTATVTIQAK